VQRKLKRALFESFQSFLAFSYSFLYVAIEEGTTFIHCVPQGVKKVKVPFALKNIGTPFPTVKLIKHWATFSKLQPYQLSNIDNTCLLLTNITIISVIS